MLIDNWKRTLTHGYAQWCIYATIFTHVAMEMLPYLGESIPSWFPISLLLLTLALRLKKQKTVSGEDDDE